MRTNRYVIAALGGWIAVHAATARAQECAMPRPDSSLVWAVVDSLRSGGLPARQRGVTIESAALHSGSECVAALALRWDGGSDGALVMLDDRGRRLLVRNYPNIRQIRPAGYNRIAFSYTAAEGALAEDEEFLVLCSFGTRYWVPCLSIPERRLVTSGSTHGDRGLFAYLENDVSLEGDEVLVHRRVRWAVANGTGMPTSDAFRESDLGVVRLRLP